MPALIWTLLGSAFAFLVKHPFVLKMMIFAIFTGLVAFALNFMFDQVRPYVVQNSVFVLASYFGVLQAISLYLTIIIAGFGVKQVLAFVRST
ncbi:MAG: hypothetical protein NT103_07530 [Campylobacterales bacterium]|nr:hypothetical protein [Campylobacterales bacterium]